MARNADRSWVRRNNLNLSRIDGSPITLEKQVKLYWRACRAALLHYHTVQRLIWDRTAQDLPHNAICKGGICRRRGVLPIGKSTISRLKAIPQRWWLSGSHPAEYTAGIDKTQAHSGSQSASLVNRADAPSAKGFATLMQVVSTSNYEGKRVRMSAWLRTKDVESWASLWLSVYGTGGRLNVSFDNMCDRTISGTNAWERFDIVLDVPIDATKFTSLQGLEPR
jgi:hypothetical protein